MSFAIDRGSLHRPLGFELALPRAIVAQRKALACDGGARTSTLEGEIELRLPVESFVVASARGVVDGRRVSVLGVASGRMVPGERTALRAWLSTDARPSAATLAATAKETRARSFATIAGLATPVADDSVVVLANGLAGAEELELASIGATTLLVGLVAVAQLLVRQLLEQTFEPKRALLVQVSVSGASDEESATRLAESVCSSRSVRGALETTVDAKSLDAATSAMLDDSTNDARRTVRVVRSRDGSTAAIGVDLKRGGATATRWTAVPAANPHTERR